MLAGVETDFIAFDGASFASSQNHPALLLYSFHAQHVGMPLRQQEALHHHPNANQVIAATCKVYLAELMGSDRERSNERQLRDMTRALCRDVGLRAANPTQRSGSCIDIVLASRSLIVEDLLVVHDGDTCSCLPDSYHPIRSSDHTLILSKLPPHRQPMMWETYPGRACATALQLSVICSDSCYNGRRNLWSCARVSPPLEEARAALDVFFLVEFVSMVWQAAEPFTLRRPVGNQCAAGLVG